ASAAPPPPPSPSSCAAPPGHPAPPAAAPAPPPHCPCIAPRSALYCPPGRMKKTPHKPDPLVAAAEAMPEKARRKGRNRHVRYGNTKGNGDYETRAWERNRI